VLIARDPLRQRALLHENDALKQRPPRSDQASLFAALDVAPTSGFLA
jgi:hypothetical protein